MPISLEPLKPKDALAYFRQKGLEPAFSYQDVWQEEHSKAFTVAKVLDVGLLQDYRAELDRAMEDGLPFESFQKAMRAHLAEHGMDGVVEVTDPVTGKTARVNLSSKRRLRTVFDTNMRQAYNQGNWQRAWQTRQLLPYLLYHHNDVRFPRPEHVAWDGVCLPIEHPFWKTHYPQCAWGCKCSTESLSADMLRARGITVTPDGDIPAFPKVQFVNSRTGEVSQVEKGIDPSFNYNVGTAPLRGVTPRPAPPPPGVGNAYYVQADAEIDSFLGAVGAKDKPRTLTDADGWPQTFSRDLFVDAAGEPRIPRPDLPGTLPDVGKALAKGSRSGRWLWSDELPALTPAQDKAVDDLWVKATGKGAPPAAKVGLARVPAPIGKLSAEAGTDITGFSHVADGSGVRHTWQRHGVGNELAADQIPVTLADLKSIPDFVNVPDMIAFGLVDDRGQPAVGFVKQRAEDVVVYIASIRRRELALKTMFKLTAGASEARIEHAINLGLTSGTAAAQPAKILRTAGKINPPKPYLVRRYRVQLDNLIYTVDFANGVWTYDIEPAVAAARP